MSKQIDSIPLLVVKSFVKSTKTHGKYPNLHAMVSRKSILSVWGSKLKPHKCEILDNIHNFRELANWLNGAVVPAQHFNIDKPATYPILYKYVTDLTNTLLHILLEPQGIPMNFLGEIGQTTYNLACKAILQDKFVDEAHDTREINEITNPEELKSRLFHEFLNSVRNGQTMPDANFGDFLSHRLSPNTLDNLFNRDRL